MYIHEENREDSMIKANVRLVAKTTKCLWFRLPMQLYVQGQWLEMGAKDWAGYAGKEGCRGAEIQKRDMPGDGTDVRVRSKYKQYECTINTNTTHSHPYWSSFATQRLQTLQCLERIGFRTKHVEQKNRSSSAPSPASFNTRFRSSSFDTDRAI